MIVDYQCRSSSNARFLIHYYFVHHLLTYLSAVSRYLFRISTVAKRSFQNITDRTRCTGLTYREEQNMIKVIHTPLINTRRSSMQSLSHNTFFFLTFEEISPSWKAYFMGSGEGVKSRLSQVLTRGAHSDSNSKPIVQISNFLPLRYFSKKLVSEHTFASV
jgi:hypothetical protein